MAYGNEGRPNGKPKQPSVYQFGPAASGTEMVSSKKTGNGMSKEFNSGKAIRKAGKSK